MVEQQARALCTRADVQAQRAEAAMIQEAAQGAVWQEAQGAFSQEAPEARPQVERLQEDKGPAPSSTVLPRPGSTERSVSRSSGVHRANTSPTPGPAGWTGAALRVPRRPIRPQRTPPTAPTLVVGSQSSSSLPARRPLLPSAPRTRTLFPSTWTTRRSLASQPRERA